jgi:GDP-D-mannose dehydratase
LGDATKAKQLLGWELEISFDERVIKMVEYDLVKGKNEKIMGVMRRMVSDLL